MDTKTQAILNTLAGQRNNAMDALVNLQAELADRDAKIAELEDKVKELTSKAE